jgi:FkbM family methyltransferase
MDIQKVEISRLSYDFNEKSFIMNVGGFDGEWARKAFEKFNCKIQIFEPVKKFYDQSMKLFKSSDNVNIYNFGLWKKNEQMEIAINGDSTSIFGKNNKEVIQLVDVKNVFDEHAIEFVDLFEVNIEGSEYDLLDRMIETNLHLKCQNLQIQFHKVIPDAVERRNQILEKLSKTHERTWNYEFIWENWRKK